MSQFDAAFSRRLAGEFAPPPAIRRRRRHRGVVVLFAAAALALLSLTGISFLADSAETTIPITALAAPGGGSTLEAGENIAVRDPFALPVFTVKKGIAHQDTGRQLFRIEVNPSLSHKVVASFMWLDVQDANGALKNGWMQVGIYYKREDAPCSVPADLITLDAGGNQICVTPAADVNSSTGSAMLNRTRVDATLKSTTAGQSNLYVIASVYNQGGNIPPGEQGDLGSLKYAMTARAK